MGIIERRREFQQILNGDRDILPGAQWLDKHLKNFPDGELPEQKLEVTVDGGKFRFTVPSNVKAGDIEKAMKGL